MTADLVQRLASLPTLSRVPREELEWLTAHGELEQLEAGATVAERDERIVYLSIILSGRLSVHRDTPVGRRRVMDWGVGEVTGRLPYSRMTVANVDIVLDEATEWLKVHERHFTEMAHQCPVFTAHTVHLMVDRARRFTANELQTEKLLSLGRLSAGLAHEINNPASAAVRGAATLREGLSEAEAASKALFLSGLPETSMAKLETARSACQEPSAFEDILSPLEAADREAALEDWLVEHGCEPQLAASLGETAVTLEALDDLAEEIPAEALGAAIRWLAATCATRAVAGEIEGAVKRIHELVAAVKRFTYMDNLAGPESVDIAAGLKDTVTVLATKARDKGATIRLDLPADLPPVRATGSELNQIWMNLIDNALDAIPESGHIEIDARRGLDRVVVTVSDDGHGIPEETLPRIFDPFFTTKGPGAGTGLGLDIVRRLVSQHGGGIDVDSRPGRTEFRVTLLAHSETGPESDDGEP